MNAMPPGVRQNAAEPSAPTISAYFLTGSTEIGLDRIRTRLLDLTNRNKLLNFRHSNASSLRVVDVPLDPVFVRLRAEEKLHFLPVPEPGIHLKDTNASTSARLRRLRTTPTLLITQVHH